MKQGIKIIIKTAMELFRTQIILNHMKVSSEMDLLMEKARYYHQKLVNSIKHSGFKA